MLLVEFVDHHCLGFGNLSTNVLVPSKLGVFPNILSCGLKYSGTLEYVGEPVSGCFNTGLFFLSTRCLPNQVDGEFSLHREVSFS